MSPTRRDIGVRPDGTEEVVVLEDGYRESAESWRTVLLRAQDGVGVLGDVEVDDPPAMMDKHSEDEQDGQARRWPDPIDPSTSWPADEILADGR